MKAVFLDKDGTLIEDVPYNVDIRHIKLTPNAIEGLRLLQQAGYKLIVITNQSGIARGYFPESALIEVEERLRQLLNPAGIDLEGFYYCPHHPDGVVPEFAIACECRKPAPELILRAAYEHNIDLRSSWFIGDILNDVEAGHRAGCKTVLIDNGNETEWHLSPLRTPDFIATNLLEAAQLISPHPLPTPHTPHPTPCSHTPHPLPTPYTLLSYPTPYTQVKKPPRCDRSSSCSRSWRSDA